MQQQSLISVPWLPAYGTAHEHGLSWYIRTPVYETEVHASESVGTAAVLGDQGEGGGVGSRFAGRMQLNLACRSAVQLCQGKMSLHELRLCIWAPHIRHEQAMLASSQHQRGQYKSPQLHEPGTSLRVQQMEWQSNIAACCIDGGSCCFYLRAFAIDPRVVQLSAERKLCKCVTACTVQVT